MSRYDWGYEDNGKFAGAIIVNLGPYTSLPKVVCWKGTLWAPENSYEKRRQIL